MIPNPKYFDVIICIYNNDKSYSIKLMKDLNITWSYMYKIIKFLNKNNLIQIKNEGRKKIIHITEKGKELSEHILKINNLIKNNKK